MFGDFEVNFLPELKHLQDDGYNILTYDLRNCGFCRDETARSAVSGSWSAGTLSVPSVTQRAERIWRR